MPDQGSQPNVLMCGTGEYTTGFVGGGQSPSDKKLGVVGLVLFDLRRRKLVGPELSMVGTNGDKFDGIRNHFKNNIEGKYRDMDTQFLGFPEKGKRDPDAYKAAIDKLKPGDAITIFTPDSTHHAIALYALQRKIHVLVTKPATQTLEHHLELIKVAKEQGVLCMVEHHKRFDPAYADGREKARSDLGDLSYFYSYMSQPKNQLSTFKAWAGIESDISYYLNSHHIDIALWMTKGKAVPYRVTASGSRGIANSPPYDCIKGTEDTISLLVDFAILGSDGNPAENKNATAVFTASWSAPIGAGVHSEQNFHYVGTKGEVRVNQARRGYTYVLENEGRTGGTSSDLNPFYMKYTPDTEGYFSGQNGYGYISLEAFIKACTSINRGDRKAEDYDQVLPTISDTVLVTAILQAGRISLDQKRSVDVVRQGDGWLLQ
ncbi:NAD(P)-binding protein [Violaceomyces palustris]|uniref:NAD(P)-binding protein n=1 Tax=Violaceomyces palustris TaxID=1673888 RepID=A0ACD0NR98_9BASI|nr:NAD(P)-binding protein [Violaceomyces palustris]